MSLQTQLTRIVKQQKPQANVMRKAILSQIHETPTERVATNAVEILRVFEPIEQPIAVNLYPDYQHVIDLASVGLSKTVIMDKIRKTDLKPFKDYVSEQRKLSKSKVNIPVNVAIANSTVLITSHKTDSLLLSFRTKQTQDVAPQLWDGKRLLNTLNLVSEQQRASKEPVQFAVTTTDASTLLIRVATTDFEYVISGLRH